MCKKRLSQPQRSILPTRVLDVGSGEGSQVTLVEKKGYCDWYVALSHCWGTGDDLKSQMSDLQQKLRNSVDPKALPKTFRDAVHFTRRIGVQFLWIDSFCINQDSDADWEEQAPKMASVYQGALCTISAAASRDGHGGLYDSEKMKPYVQFEHLGRRLVAYCHVDYKAIEKSTLNTRAWVLQEWILSPRLVHFTEDGIFWECVSHVASRNHDIDFHFTHIQDQFYANEEDRIFPVMARAAVSGSFHTWQRLYEIWARLIEDYTCRKMTFREDKFAALAGLTTAFKRQLQDVSIAGLWRADFHMGLLWSVESYSSIDTIYLEYSRYKAPEWKAAIPGIPSWSWASIDGPIYYGVHRGARFVNDLRINDVQVEWKNDVRDYQSLGGRINGEAILRPVHVTYRGAHDCDLCFNAQLGRPSEIKQATSPLSSKLSKFPEDLWIALKESKTLDGEERDVSELFLLREALLSVPPFVGQYRHTLKECELVTCENGMQKPLDFLHGRGSLDRPLEPTKGSQDCTLTALLVATELRPDADIGGGIIPYANHVLFVEKTDVEGEFRRIGVGVFWARHGYFERIRPQHVVIR